MLAAHEGDFPKPSRSAIDSQGGFTLPKEWSTERGDLLAAATVSPSSIVIYRLGAFDDALRRARTAEFAGPGDDAAQHFASAASAVEVNRLHRIYLPTDLAHRAGLEFPAAVSVFSDSDRIVLAQPEQEARASSFFHAAPSLNSPALWTATSTEMDLKSAANLLRLTLLNAPSTIAELRGLDPRAFEEWVGERLEEEGYVVTMSPLGPDGGIDLFAARHDRLGSFVYGVQCKRYSESNPVRVQLVRELAGVLEVQRLTAGLLVTTSRFTRPARREASSDRLSMRISLRDSTDLEGWLGQYGPGLVHA